jgi:hypothetical protein
MYPRESSSSPMPLCGGIMTPIVYYCNILLYSFGMGISSDPRGKSTLNFSM